MEYRDLDRDMVGRCKERKKLMHNTYAYRDNDLIKIKYHDTFIMVFEPCGKITLDPAGRHTSTTKIRLNEFLPFGFRVWQTQGIWWIGKGWGADKFLFKDGMTIENEELKGHGGTDNSKQRRLAKDITKYVKGYMTALKAGKVSKPGAGDCMFCGMVDKSGKTWGEHGPKGSKDHHIMSHIEESYYVPSLIAQALKSMGASRAAQWTLWSLWDESTTSWDCWDQVQRCLSKYIKRELGVGT